MESGRKQDRKAVGLLVKLQHANVDTFAEEYATNLSPGGMFIRSRQPQPIGTPVKFEVQIAGGVRVMKGSAIVRWIRQANDPAGAPGMGVQFDELDPATRGLVDRMVAAAAAAAAPAKPPAATKPSTAGAKPAAASAAASARVSTARPSTATPGARTATTTRSPAAPGARTTATVPNTAAPAADTAVPAAPADDSAAELEAQLRAIYGDPAARKPAPGMPPVVAIAPAVPRTKAPVAPVIVPAVPTVAAAAPPPDIDFDFGASSAIEDDEPTRGSAGEDLPFELEPAADTASADVSIDFEASGGTSSDEVSLELETEASESAPGSDVAIDFDIGSPAEGEEEVPIETDTGAAPANSIDVSLDALIAETPAPEPSGDEPFMPFDAPPAVPAADVRPPPAFLFDDTEFVVEGGTPPPVAAPITLAPAPPAGASQLPVMRRGPTPVVAPVQNVPPPTLGKPTVAPAARPVAKKAGPVFLTPPAQIDPTGPVIGIDLGTTNSCVGILQNGKPVVMRSKQGYNTLPSIVSLTQNGKLLVAHSAKQQMVLNPHRTIYGAKRLVGRSFDSPTVRQVKERFHYEVCADDTGKAAVRLGDHVLSLEEVQGLVLRECKEMAEREMGKAVSRAVVTVPAYYSEPQREAVRKAGAMAGLKVERILNEPTAAALAFGMNREMNKRVLVYDLGGGTFDVTVLKIEGNVFEVLATGGDTFLGGTDFDNLLVDLLLQKFQQTEKVPFSGDSVALSRVSELAEKAKCALSERETFEVHIPMLVMDPNGGKAADLRCTLTRKELNDAALPLIERTLEAVRDVLLDAQMKAKDVDDVILVGGQSRMPLVREMLKELFGKPAQASVNADEAVALGAALYSGSVDKVSSVVLIDVLPMTIGVAGAGGAFKRVIERNTPLPAQRSFSLPTSRDNETTLEFEVFQGEDANVAGNEYLGTVRIEGLPKAPKGIIKVAVTLRLDAECVLHAEALELGSRKKVQISLATRHTPEEVQKKLGISPDAVNRVQKARAEELKSRAGGFWGLIKRVIGKPERASK